MKKLLGIFFIFLWAVTHAQPGKEAWTWCFGGKARLDFSSGSPVSGYGPTLLNTFEGSASISDPNTGQYLFSVGNECFAPQPKVQSGVIRLTKNKNQLPVKSERAFWVLVKTAFNQRRKTLRNGVKSLFAKEILDDDLFNRRAETLSVEEFAALTFKMS